MAETLGERIDHLIKLTGGTMEVAMIVETEEEAEAARALIATRRAKGARLVEVLVDPRKAQ